MARKISAIHGARTARLEVALGQELVVGGYNRVAADAESLGERPGRRQPAAGGELSIEDIASKEVAELAVDRDRKRAVERHRVEKNAGSVCHGIGPLKAAVCALGKEPYRVGRPGRKHHPGVVGSACCSPQERST